jgi:hypothetical protein
MKNILIDLYYGRISPWESAVPPDPVYRRAWDRVSKLEQTFLSRLNPEEQTLYETIEKERVTPTEMEREETFVEGFRLGVRIMAEALKRG